MQSANSRPGARVQVEDHPVGESGLRVDRAGVLRSRAHPPLGHMDLERGHLREIGQGRKIVDQGIAFGAGGVPNRSCSDPRRCGVREVLLEEHIPGVIGSADAVDPTFSGGDPVPGMADEVRGDPGAVVEDLTLRRAGLRVEDLVQIAQCQSMALDRDLLLVTCHWAPPLCTVRAHTQDRPFTVVGDRHGQQGVRDRPTIPSVGVGPPR